MGPVLEDGPQFAVILGAPRSGTTWLQRLLGAHPQVACTTETGLFTQFLGPADDRWTSQSRALEQVLASLGRGESVERRINGLPSLLTGEDLDRWARAAVTALADRAVEEKPAARVVVEKTPSNALWVGLIDRLVPSCRYIHIVRDPRDVAASLIAAGRSWGSSWAPVRPQRTATMWREHVLGAREAARFGPRYVELRYEDLRRDAKTHIAQLHRFLGVDALERDTDEPQPGRLVVRRDIEQRFPGAGSFEPEGMGDGSRLYALTAAQQLAVTRHVGDLLAEFGYEDSTRWPPVPARTRWTRSPLQITGERARSVVKTFVLRRAGIVGPGVRGPSRTSRTD